MTELSGRSKASDLKLADPNCRPRDESGRLKQWVNVGIDTPTEADRRSIEHFQNMTTERRRQPVAGVVARAQAFLEKAGPLGKTYEPTSLTRNASQMIQRALKKNWDLDNNRIRQIVADILETLHDTRQNRHLAALQTLVDLDERHLLTARGAAA